MKRFMACFLLAACGGGAVHGDDAAETDHPDASLPTSFDAATASPSDGGSSVPDLRTASDGGAAKLGTFGVEVVGGKLVSTTDGKTEVHLRGADVSGFEFSAVNDNQPVTTAGILQNQTASATPWNDMAGTWKMNVVRIPLNESSWLGQHSCYDFQNSTTKDADPNSNYQQIIKDVVAGFTGAKMYVILDLHWNAPGDWCSQGQIDLPDADNSPDFWKGVATAFKDNPAVLLDLYNEPYGASGDWSCWLNGCLFPHVEIYPNVYSFTEPGASQAGYNTAGMQTLVNTVRATGATNVIMVGGIAGATDLSQWLQYEPKDPTGNITASLHYNVDGEAADTAKLIAAGVPVIIGECGAGDAGNISDAETLVKNTGAHILVWNYNQWGGGTLINSGGAVSSTTGAPYKSWLATQ